MIHKFGTTDIPPIDRVGGTARSLIEATRAGFSVPDGIVLDIDFFRDCSGRSYAVMRGQRVGALPMTNCDCAAARSKQAAAS